MRTVCDAGDVAGDGADPALSCDVTIAVDGMDRGALQALRKGLHIDVSVGEGGDASRIARGNIRVHILGCPDAGSGTDSPGEERDAPSAPQEHAAVISMQSRSSGAERLFRSAVVAVDAVVGNQVEGISPLYHVSNLDGPDSMAAVMQIATRLAPSELAGVLRTIADTHEGMLSMDIVDVRGERTEAGGGDHPSGRSNLSAAVLAPWFDMDPDATLGKDRVSFLLASAPDAMRVGMLSDNWIIGADL
ncbi:MAG: hypothetical protein LKI88_01840 [Bifidobacterium sp.]|jgi:dihydroneopterin aldolase/2-amino-4-hydroxy-6-hydroxymethyldihydropteridine diphosphokinase|nr:hypothetical protein [Bifidobacterium sp.]MCI1864666.1 hypothetical protein [Bifidobacterium sp.]